MSTATTTVWDIAARVVDPEIPVLTIADLGILRSVEIDGDTVVCTITPTYSGCPAMRQIEDDLRQAFASEGLEQVEVRTGGMVGRAVHAPFRRSRPRALTPPGSRSVSPGPPVAEGHRGRTTAPPR